MADVANIYLRVVPSMNGFGAKVTSAFKDAGIESSNKFAEGVSKGTGKASAAIGIIAGVASNVASIAFDALGNAVGGAIERLDILNNYPKVMQNLGYSAEDSANSIGLIKEHLLGLPSTTQDIASFVQQLASSSGNLKEATDLGLAFNDMMLAGGQSSEVAANAMQMFSKMMATGKFNAQQWQTVVAAAPGQVNMLAKALLGATATEADLQAALKSGEISIDTFKAAIIDLGQNGSDGIASFSEQARSATEGVVTSFENIIPRLSNAMADILDAIGQKNISGVINGFSSSFSNVAKYIIGIVKDVKTNLSGMDFSPVSNAFERLGESFSGLMSALAPIVTKLISTAVPVFAAIAQRLANIGNIIASVLMPVLKLLAPVINGIIDIAGNVFLGLLDTLNPVLEGIAGWLRDAFTPVLEQLQPIFDALGNVLAQLSETFSAAFEGANPLVDVLSFLGSLIGGVLNVAITTFLGVIAGALTQAVNTLNFAFTQLGEVIHLVAAIFTGDWNGACEAVQNLFSNFVNFIGSIFGNILNTVCSIASSIAENMRGIFGDGVGAVINFFRNLPGQIMGALGNLGNLLVDAGRQMIEGFFNGIKNAITGVFDFVGGIAGKIASLKGPLPYDRKVLIPNGLALMQSLNTGIEKGLKPVLATVSGIAGTIEDTLKDSMQAKVVQKVGASLTADADEFSRKVIYSMNETESTQAAKNNGVDTNAVISWLASNLPIIISESTPVMGDKTFDRKVRRAINYV